MSELHNKLVIVTGIDSPYRGEIGYTTLCSSDDKYAVQFPTHKTIINRSNLSLYSCVLQKLDAAEQERDELDERRDELLVVIADKDREAEAARRTGSMWKDELIEANKQIEAAEETSNDWRILAHNLELILRTKEATIKEISELPEKWRYHGDGECNCLTCVCANELQAVLNPSPPRS